MLLLFVQVTQYYSPVVFDELPMFVGFSSDLAAALARLQLAKLQVAKLLVDEDVLISISLHLHRPQIDDDVTARVLDGRYVGPLRLERLSLQKLRSIINALKLKLHKTALPWMGNLPARQRMRCFLIMSIFTTRTNNLASFKVITRMLSEGMPSGSRVRFVHVLSFVLVCCSRVGSIDEWQHMILTPEGEALMLRLTNVQGQTRDRSKFEYVRQILSLDDTIIDTLIQDPSTVKVPGIDVKHINVLRLYVLGQASVVRVVLPSALLFCVMCLHVCGIPGTRHQCVSILYAVGPCAHPRSQHHGERVHEDTAAVWCLGGRRRCGVESQHVVGDQGFREGVERPPEHHRSDV